MRKMKKINGYLVVRFNDREKREYEGTGLGSFGVIDAELYTGILDIDRSVMEYDDAETLEIALEQARGLESELDVVEPEVKITVIIEGETKISEEEVNPERLFQAQRASLEDQLKRGECLDLTPLTAVHELRGYAIALDDLGMIDGYDERFLVERDTFGVTAPPSDRQEEVLAYICDEVCKYREGRTQEELNAICAKCKVDRWAGAPPTLTSPGGAEEVKRDTFTHAHPDIQRDRMTRKVYALGLALADDCPENDCKVYLNIFNMARELDKALDGATGYPATVLRGALHDRLRELAEMYTSNYAVQQHKEGMQK